MNTPGSAAIPWPTASWSRVSRRPDHRDRNRHDRAAGLTPAARAGHSGPGQRALARLPPGAALAHPTRPRIVLDLARPDVPRRRAAEPRALPAAGPGRVRRDGARRNHLRRRIPLRAPRCRRHALRRPERDGPGRDRRRRRRRHPPHPARHLLSEFRARRVTAGDGPQQRFGDGTGDRWAERVEALRQRRRHGPSRRRRNAFRPGGARRPDACRRGMGGRATVLRCTSTRRSRPPRSTQCLAVHGRTPTAAAARRRGARAAHDGRARHPPDRRGHRRHGPDGDRGLLLPHHRT